VSTSSIFQYTDDGGRFFIEIVVIDFSKNLPRNNIFCSVFLVKNIVIALRSDGRIFYMSSAQNYSSYKDAKILFVDDDPITIHGMSQLLSHDFTILTAESGEDALRQLEIPENRIEVVVSDVYMPGMDGASLLRKVASCRPDIVRIMLTGATDIQTAVKAVNDGSVFRLITKPCHIQQLQAAIREALSHRRSLLMRRDAAPPDDANRQKLAQPSSEPGRQSMAASNGGLKNLLLRNCEKLIVEVTSYSCTGRVVMVNMCLAKIDIALSNPMFPPDLFEPISKLGKGIARDTHEMRISELFSRVMEVDRVHSPSEYLALQRVLDEAIEDANECGFIDQFDEATKRKIETHKLTTPNGIDEASRLAAEVKLALPPASPHNKIDARRVVRYSDPVLIIDCGKYGSLRTVNWSCMGFLVRSREFVPDVGRRLKFTVSCNFLPNFIEKLEGTVLRMDRERNIVLSLPEMDSKMLKLTRALKREGIALIPDEGSIVRSGGVIFMNLLSTGSLFYNNVYILRIFL
jgi:FixJ family two-component response regulator